MKYFFFLLLIIPFIGSAQLDPLEVVLKKERERDAKYPKKQAVINEKENLELPFPIDSATGMINFIEVVKADNSTAQDLYSRAKLFVSEAYKSNKAVTQLNDDVAKVLVIKPLIENRTVNMWTGNAHGFTGYQLKVECKDNKYRYSISGFSFTLDGTNSAYPLEGIKPKFLSKKEWADVREQCYLHINEIIIPLLKKQLSSNLSDF